MLKSCVIVGVALACGMACVTLCRADVCASKREAFDKINIEYQRQVANLDDVYRRCGGGGPRWTGSDNPGGVESKAELDGNGTVHYYVAERDAQGVLTKWEEVPKNPNLPQEGDKLEDSSLPGCNRDRDDALNMCSQLASAMEAIPSLSCDDAFSLVGCSNGYCAFMLVRGAMKKAEGRGAWLESSASEAKEAERRRFVDAIKAGLTRYGRDPESFGKPRKGAEEENGRVAGDEALNDVDAVRDWRIATPVEVSGSERGQTRERVMPDGTRELLFDFDLNDDPDKIVLIPPAGGQPEYIDVSAAGTAERQESVTPDSPADHGGGAPARWTENANAAVDLMEDASAGTKMIEGATEGLSSLLGAVSEVFAKMASEARWLLTGEQVAEAIAHPDDPKATGDAAYGLLSWVPGGSLFEASGGAAVEGGRGGINEIINYFIVELPKVPYEDVSYEEMYRAAMRIPAAYTEPYVFSGPIGKLLEALLKRRPLW